MADKEHQEYKKLLKFYNLSDAEVGQMFGYPNPASWRNTTAKRRLENQVMSIVEAIEERMINKLKR